MRISILKVALLAAVAALPSVASAKGMMKPPPGACAFGKKWIATGTICSFNCDPKTMVCAQQLCVNGGLNLVLPCYDGFCAVKCGG
ncbi:MAG TPA: hypothetical protein VEK75_14085 [Xanthobacteraceae bacterium]|nr:hypothetical protein [Xanthobacteraceae bacterium]